MPDQPTSKPSELIEQIIGAVCTALGYIRFNPITEEGLIKAISATGLAALEQRLTERCACRFDRNTHDGDPAVDACDYHMAIIGELVKAKDQLTEAREALGKATAHGAELQRELEQLKPNPNPPTCADCGGITELLYRCPYCLQDLQREVERLKAFIPLAEEVARARTKFSKPDHLFPALIEEAGELAEALLETWRGGEGWDWQGEALQVACVAFRIYEEGDPRIIPIEPEQLRAALAQSKAQPSAGST